MPTAVVDEIEPQTIINRVQTDMFNFRWTINPYRGCQHSCVYCFARHTHAFFGYNTGDDFNNRIMAKVNAEEQLRRELRRPGWKKELIALGASVDPWQPLEAKYQITRGILRALRDFANPVAILTKSTLVLRDKDLLAELAAVAQVQVNFSVGTLDETVWKLAEPGTPHPLKRIEAMGELVRAGVPAGIMLAPIMPGLTDSEESIEGVIRAAAQHGAQSLAPVVLHLRPGTKEWFMPWLREMFPGLLETYARLYPRRYAYTPQEFQERIHKLVRHLMKKWRVPAGGRLAQVPRGQLALPL
ncbi:MAG: radical SAM protein [Chloroflexi bacterium]|nr:radical SAM protein [Chloroflexota bacterium]